MRVHILSLAAATAASAALLLSLSVCDAGSALSAPSASIVSDSFVSHAAVSAIEQDNVDDIDADPLDLNEFVSETADVDDDSSATVNSGFIDGLEAKWLDVVREKVDSAAQTRKQQSPDVAAAVAIESPAPVPSVHSTHKQLPLLLKLSTGPEPAWRMHSPRPRIDRRNRMHITASSDHARSNSADMEDDSDAQPPVKVVNMFRGWRRHHPSTVSSLTMNTFSLPLKRTAPTPQSDVTQQQLPQPQQQQQQQTPHIPAWTQRPSDTLYSLFGGRALHKRTHPAKEHAAAQSLDDDLTEDAETEADEALAASANVSEGSRGHGLHGSRSWERQYAAWSQRFNARRAQQQAEDDAALQFAIEQQRTPAQRLALLGTHKETEAILPQNPTDRFFRFMTRRPYINSQPPLSMQSNEAETHQLAELMKQARFDARHAPLSLRRHCNLSPLSRAAWKLVQVSEQIDPADREWKMTMQAYKRERAIETKKAREQAKQIDLSAWHANSGFIL